MNIVHLVSGNLSGGAARGAYWLHRGLLDLGVDSVILNNGRDVSTDPSVIPLAFSAAQKARFILLSRLASLPEYLYPKRKSWIFNTGFDGIDFTRHPAYKAADLVHLHWINGLVAMGTLRKVRKPIIWTMRDMWPMTGGCHVAAAFGCERYTTGCGQCPQLGSNYDWDLSKLVVVSKKLCVPQHMHLVGISNWLSECASRSELFRGFPIHTISNNIDTRDFFPVDPRIARQVLGLPLDKKIVLVGCHSLNDFHKGFDLFLEAIKGIERADVHVVLFGQARPGVVHSQHTQSSLGFLSDTISLRLAYSAADVFVAPSRMDAFGKTLAEAMACGTPVVCFDATGPADVVEHKITGYKAKPFETRDLQVGIDWVLSQSTHECKMLRDQARQRAETIFDSRVIASQYVTLYGCVLSKSQT